MLLREGAEPTVSEKFYRAVIQVVLLFGADTWVFSVPMEQRLDRVHVGFLRQVTNLKAKSLSNGSWRKVATEKVLQGACTQPLHNYLERRQSEAAEWKALRPIFDVYARETGYEGGVSSGCHGGDRRKQINS